MYFNLGGGGFQRISIWRGGGGVNWSMTKTEVQVLCYLFVYQFLSLLMEVVNIDIVQSD